MAGYRAVFERVLGRPVSLRPDARLVLTGRRFAGVQVPADALWLGYLPDTDMPALYQALDVVAVMNTPGAFGDYSYPIKLYEAMACGRPVVASRTASTAWVLRDFPDRLVAPGDAAALAGALISALDLGAVDYGAQADWTALGAELEAAMRGLGGDHRPCRSPATPGDHRAAQLRFYSGRGRPVLGPNR